MYKHRYTEFFMLTLHLFFSVCTIILLFLIVMYFDFWLENFSEILIFSKLFSLSLATYSSRWVLEWPSQVPLKILWVWIWCHKYLCTNDFDASKRAFGVLLHMHWSLLVEKIDFFLALLKYNGHITFCKFKVKQDGDVMPLHILKWPPQ